MKNRKFFTKTPPLSHPLANFNGFYPSTTLLKKGDVHTAGHKSLECDIVFERDVLVELRDKIKVRIDVFRPNTDEKVPVILCSSIFGKNGSYITYDFVAERCGSANRCNVPRKMTSGLDAFECPDPGFWCLNNYAIVYMDPRGVGMSEGDAHYFGTQDATDNYDVIEWLAKQEWCNGKVAMGGNSWLGITQWYTAALSPPHLTCIAPWEGHGNMYVDEYMRGGIPHISIVRVNMCYGNNHMEDLPAAMKAYPLMNDYWEDKAADFEKITVPAYVVASYTSQVHARGTFDGFRRISSKEKWLRVHNNQEWGDLHRPENEEDLLKFFDFYLKEIPNDWAKTSRVRLSVLNPGHQDIVYRNEETFPLERQNLKKMYLDIDKMSLNEVKPEVSATKSYISDDGQDTLSFTYIFNERTEITGYIKLHIWAAAKEHYDMDIYGKISKKNSNGKYLFNDAVTYQYGGPNTMLRASLRELDREKSSICEPVHTFTKPQLLNPGIPIILEMGFWPTSLLFEAGEQLELTIAGFDYKGLDSPRDSIRDNGNIGEHIIYSGDEYDSHLILPVIPPNNS